MRWIVFAITLVIGALAVIVPPATHWPEPAAAVGLGIGALVAALWAGIRGLVAQYLGIGLADLGEGHGQLGPRRPRLGGDGRGGHSGRRHRRDRPIGDLALEGRG